MLATANVGKLQTQPPFFVRLARKSKQTLNDFDEDEGGMNTVEAIILLFVAAVVLIVFFTVFWDKIKTAVTDALERLFQQEG